MPTYSFEDTKTGEQYDKFMSWKDREKYLEENPDVKADINSLLYALIIHSLMYNGSNCFKFALSYFLYEKPYTFKHSKAKSISFSV